MIQTKFKRQDNTEVLTFAGAVVTIVILSTSQFKLPHYINPFLPLYAEFTVSYLNSLKNLQQLKTTKVFLFIQYFVTGVSVIGMILLLFFTFEFPATYTLIGMSVLLLYLGRVVFKNELPYLKIINLSVVMMVFLNFGLNAYFYPELLQYQAGISISKLIEEKKIPKEHLYIYNKDYSWTLDFYTKRNTPSLTLNHIENLEHEIWLITDKIQSFKELQENNIAIREEYVVDYFRVTKLNLKFLNPKSRSSKLSKAYLLRITP